jgi:hypothetical protein
LESSNDFIVFAAKLFSRTVAALVQTIASGRGLTASFAASNTHAMSRIALLRCALQRAHQSSLRRRCRAARLLRSMISMLAANASARSCACTFTQQARRCMCFANGSQRFVVWLRHVSARRRARSRSRECLELPHAQRPRRRLMQRSEPTRPRQAPRHERRSWRAVLRLDWNQPMRQTERSRPEAHGPDDRS